MRRLLGIGMVAMAMFTWPDSKALGAQSDDARPIKRSVTIVQEATLGGRTVERGRYDAEITRDGADATLVLTRDKREVARVRVRRDDLSAASKYDRVDVRSSARGKEVVSVYFKGDRAAFSVVDDDGVAVAEKP
jgi:hypothetical protein